MQRERDVDMGEAAINPDYTKHLKFREIQKRLSITSSKRPACLTLTLTFTLAFQPRVWNIGSVC